MAEGSKGGRVNVNLPYKMGEGLQGLPQYQTYWLQCQCECKLNNFPFKREERSYLCDKCIV